MGWRAFSILYSNMKNKTPNTGPEAKELATIMEAWDIYAKRLYPEGMCEEKRLHLQLSFFAGAMAALLNLNVCATFMDPNRTRANLDTLLKEAKAIVEKTVMTRMRN